MNVKVEVLTIPGCPHGAAAAELASAVAERLGLAVDLRHLVVDTPAAAARLRFLGSPTVRVDGVDVEPGADVRIDFSLGCRIYLTPRGPQPLPSAEWIGAAFASADGSGGGGREELGRRRPVGEVA